MNFFEQLKSLLPEGRPLHLTMLKKGELIVLSLSVASSNDDDVNLELINEIKPLNITGTAAELDADFFNVIKAPQEKIIHVLTANVNDVIESVDKAIEDNKPKPKAEKKIKIEKKEEPKKEEKDAKMYIEAAGKFMKERKWASALINLDLAKEIEPKNKFIDADIKTCNQWIKAKQEAGMFDEEKTAPELPGEIQEIVDASPNIIHATIAKPEESLELPIDL